MKRLEPALLLLLIVVLLTSCGAPSPTPAPEPTTAPIQPAVPAASAVGEITDYSIKIEQGSGDACGANATYFVTASITASGVAAAAYEASSSSSGGQIPTGGKFQDLTNNGTSEMVSGALTFDQAETKTVTWRLAGPYAYPNDITVKLRVNNGEFKSASVDCGSAAQPAPTVSAPAAGCQDSAQYLSDDGKDGTVYPPNTPFTKTWKIKNTGTCTWDSNYMVAQISGKAMSQQPAYMIVPQGKSVAPGGEADISVGLTSPSEAGDYRADWQVQNAAGVSLAQVYLTLKVQDPNAGSGSANESVTAVIPQIVLEQGSGAACTNQSTYFVYVDITAGSNVKADYRIDLTDGSGQASNGVFDSGSPEETGTELFYSAETRRISLHVTGPYSYPDALTVRVYVNDQSYGSVTAACQ